MKFPQKEFYTSKMSNENQQNQHAPQVTLINDSVTIPPFSGTGSESVHTFVRRITEECTRRSARSDAEKLAILQSRICHEPSSVAGKLVKTDKFLSFTSYAEFTDALTSHFAGHSKLGATHSLLKTAQTLTHITRSTCDVYKAENVASSLSTELLQQLKSSQWIDANDNIKANDFKRLMSYFLFVAQLDSQTFNVASDIEFKKDDFLYDVCKKITEKAPPVAQPASVTQSVPHSSFAQNSSSSQNSRHHSPPRARSTSRGFRTSHFRPRSKSRNRNVACHRCGLKGHISTYCRVVLDDQGQAQFNRDAYCSFHNRAGHTLAACRAYQAQQHQALPQQPVSHPPSGNVQRPSQPPPT